MPSVDAGPVPGRFPDLPVARREEPPPPAPRREEAPVAAPQSSDLLLGPGAEFDGKLTFRGTLRIDAKFTCSIVTDDVLIVGEHARMNAEITCGTIVVHGEVNGNVRAMAGVELRVKAELLQKTGSFKPRGVLAKLATLTPEERVRGVIGISAGNHAQALAYGAARRLRAAGTGVRARRDAGGGVRRLRPRAERARTPGAPSAGTALPLRANAPGRARRRCAGTHPPRSASRGRSTGCS